MQWQKLGQKLDEFDRLSEEFKKKNSVGATERFLQPT